MSIHKRALQQVKGLIVEWEDKNPLEFQDGHIDGKVGHRNFVYRTKAAAIWRTARSWIFENQSLKWLIKITLVFRHPELGDAGEELEEITVTGQSTIAGLNDTCMKAIGESLNEIDRGRYKTTRFFIECLGV